MKKIQILILFLFIGSAVILVYTSCTKENPSATPINIFTWTFDGILDTSSLNLASLHDMGTAGESKIIAGTGYPSTYRDRVWISLPSLNARNYTLGPGTQDSLFYFDDLETFSAISGFVNIAENNNNHISGNFSATLVNSAGTTNKSISGNFSYVEIYP